ncbi:HAD superfamily hydrolase (TIGR01509 family) [Longispora fulva]|uniref:HAD superfamily hydrolase (TIGR01509 family) n=1 Tax=Longispora fulva TaxID=619741 RepID=A0A8J7GI25_9ACTN|nr:HAD superfamily hydrolase (TIGR01509 family) [Longispora fulva]
MLVDIERIAVRIQLALGVELGWPMTGSEVVERFIGRSSPFIEEQLGDRLGPDVAATWLETYERRQAVAVESELTAVDGVVEALDGITLPTCVASNGSQAKMRDTLGRTGLYGRFEGRIFSAAEVARGKPAPDLFLYAARSMGVDPSRCVVVEDSRYGVQAARAAGMRVLGYAGGVTPAHWLEGPDTTLFDDMRTLPGLLAGLSRVGQP